ncbi:MAG: helix-turn-helix domain-containing protein [Defluviitaleaceae bacterium]|nr:helix-turn-helix domain-containing protein [Defluviitaleaceae bacterium]
MRGIHIMRDKNFKRFVISYVLILFIPLAITLYANARATDIIEANVIQTNIFKLSNFRDIFDERLARIDNAVLELSFDERLQRIIHLPITDASSPNMYWFYVFFHEFNRFAFHSVQDGDRSFLFLRNNGVVFGHNFFSSNFWDFYGDSDEDFLQFGDMPYEEFTHLLFNQRHFSRFMPAQRVTFLNRTGLYIPYIFSMPTIFGIPEYDTTRVWGAMMYLLNANELYDMITGSLDEYGGETFILDGGRIIASTGSFQGEYLNIDLNRSGDVHVSEITWDGNDTLAIYIPSGFSNLSFLTLLPLDAIRADMIMLRTVVISLTMAALLIGLIASIILSYRNTLPITQLLSFNIGLQELVSEQRKSMETLYVDKLLKNNFTSIEKLEVSLKHVGIQFGGNSYRVILVRILPSSFIPTDAPLSDWDMYRAFFINLATPRFVVHTLGNNELALIASFETEDEIEPTIRAMQEGFNGQFGFIPLCGIGEAYDNPGDIHMSLQEATTAADYADILQQDNHTIWFIDITPGDTDDLFGKEQEQCLIKLVRQGDKNTLGKYLDEAYERVRIRWASTNVRQLYLSGLHVILIKLSAETKISVNFKALEKKLTEKPSEYYLAIRSAYLDFCTQLNTSKKGRKEKLKESILSYINEYHHNSNLNVAILASHFNVAENYFSQFFSEQVGEPFSRYLERIRIEHACKLLEDNSITIDNVALQSGYSNTNTFRRAFKRVTGTTPSGYVKI